MSEKQIIVQLNPDVPPTGSDLGVVNAARRSFGKRSEWGVVDIISPQAREMHNHPERRLKDKDKRLLEFLARAMTADDFEAFCRDLGDSVLVDDTGHYDGLELSKLKESLWQWRNTPTHDTPFNHGFFSFEVKAPIFVRAQLVKHEYLIMSEFSRRYITDDIEFYEPAVWREQSEDKKQGSSGEHPLWNHGKGTGYREAEYEHNENALGLYKQMVEMGVSIEQARMVLPQSLMTAWTWSGTLGAFANMAKLRLAPDSQYETRLVAEKIYTELKRQFPVSAPLLVKGVY